MPTNVNQINNTVGSSISGVLNSLTVTNPSNTASSEAKITLTVGGGTSGDNWIEHAVGSSRSYAIGIDNSDSDKLKMTTAAAATCNPSTATPAWSFTPATGFNYDNSGTTSYGIGFNVDPNDNYSLNLTKSLNGTYGIQVNNTNTGSLARTGVNFNLDSPAYDASILLRPDNDATTIFQKKLVLNTQSATSSDGIVLNVDSAKTTLFSVNNNEIVRVSSSGISFDGGTDFLGAYDEDTWTPTIGGSAVDPTTVTYTTQVGRYIRIGNLVWANGYIVINTFTLGGGSGNLELRGLPFTTSNISGNVQICVVEFQGVDLQANTKWVNGEAIVNNTEIAFIECQDNANANVTQIGTVAAGDTISVNLMYRTG